MAAKDKKCSEKKDSLYVARGSVKVELRQPMRGSRGSHLGFNLYTEVSGKPALLQYKWLEGIILVHIIFVTHFLVCNIWHTLGIENWLLGDPRFPNLGASLAGETSKRLWSFLK